MTARYQFTFRTFFRKTGLEIITQVFIAHHHKLLKRVRSFDFGEKLEAFFEGFWTQKLVGHIKVFRIKGNPIINPLVITSFPLIRRKLKPLAWRGFHYWAYIVYGLIYVHLASITILDQWNDGTPYGNLAWLRLSLYTLIYGTYVYLKSTKTQKNALV